MGNYRWSAELQESGQKSCNLKYRRFVICAVISGAISAALAVAFIAIWCLYDGDGDAFVAIKGENFTTTDWERTIVDSGPLNYGWEKLASYKLVSYTENILEFNIAMGAPKQWLWLTKYFDDRLSVKNVGPGGLARMTWKITWKFFDLYERNEEFRLNEPFEGVYGSNLGRAIGNCTALRPNALFCQVQHTERPDWHFSTTTEFYNLGVIGTSHVPYEGDLTVKKYYERLIKSDGATPQPEKSPDTEEEAESDDDFWSMDEWEGDS